MTTLGPNLKGKLKFTCIIRTHAFTLQRSDHKQVLDFVSLSVITRHGATMAAAVATWMPTAAGVIRADANICTFANRSRPQASAGDQYPVLPSAVSAVHLQLSAT